MRENLHPIIFISSVIIVIIILLIAQLQNHNHRRQERTSVIFAIEEFSCVHRKQ